MVQGTARRGSGLCAHRVDKGSATTAAMGCDGGGNYGSVRARGTRTHDRAQVTKLKARWRRRWGLGQLTAQGKGTCARLQGPAARLMVAQISGTQGTGTQR